MPRDRGSFALLVALALLSGVATARADPGSDVALAQPGTSLDAALRALQERGLKLLWSSLVVPPEMRVVAAPRSGDPRAALDELLAPHGLAVVEEGGSLIVVAGPPPPATLRGTVRSRRALDAVAGVTVSAVAPPLEPAETTTGADGRFELTGLAPGVYAVEARRPGFVIERREELAVPGAAELEFVLQPAPLAADEIAVHPSRITLLHEEPAMPFALSRDEILALPHLGGDVFRALSLLPGTTANDVTAQFHVRGGRRDEVLVLLDGQELYEAYHLKDFDNALSVVPASALASLDLTTGAFPASYGDRMGGILDMSTVSAVAPPRLRLSLSVLAAQLESAGIVGERFGWLASARRGTTDLAGRVVGQEDPSYWDLFAKLDARPTANQSLRGNVLLSSDRLDFREEPQGELTRLDTEYDSGYLWLTHQAVLGERLFVDSAVSHSRVDRARLGLEDEEEKRFQVEDRRELRVDGVQQSWNLQAGGRHFLEAGLELRRFEADYDYWSVRTFDSPFAELRAEPREGVFAFRGVLDDDYLGAFVSDRWHPTEDLTLELGARFDRHSLTDDDAWSPRASLAWRLGSASVVRLGTGIYRQSQRAYELLVDDGDTRLYPPERSEHWVAGFEHRFAAERSPVTALRLEVYRREVREPRPRYESLFEPFEPFHEGEIDRFRVEPERSASEGAELFLRGRAGKRLDWWLSYSAARSEDTIAGAAVPREIDQRHTLTFDVDLHLGRRWELSLAWRYHTGWPTTPVLLEVEEDEEGEVELVPVLGPLRSERLPDYHRLDLRLSRTWELRCGRLATFLDVQNLYDRRNVAGFDLELDEDAGEIVALEESWPGFFASAGLTWEL